MATSRGLHARTDLQVPNEPIVYNELAIRTNMSILSYCRTFVSALSGSSAGILGLTGLEGFIFYFIVSFVFSLMLCVKAGRKWQEFFRHRQPLVTSGLLGGLFTYVLFWTFLYGMVHVY
ncbi:ER membrane protein complex subunit 6-like [Acanthaster planci]|uniref:ER membrane protein complex subunit 6 n=1 Tax=Acanthaster planci TaxID=133434 RepID=A0A8B7Y3V6_ACAPL|nr:ER membrane protein complex subunit 6-like [Acanthaster planci]